MILNLHMWEKSILFFYIYDISSTNAKVDLLAFSKIFGCHNIIANLWFSGIQTLGPI